MNDEIKEIINDLQRVADRKCYPEDILCGSIAQEWVDYITNLQAENEKLKNELETQNLDMGLEIERLNNIINELEKWLKSKIDYFDKTAKDTILHEQMAIRVIYDYLQELKGDSSN